MQHGTSGSSTASHRATAASGGSGFRVGRIAGIDVRVDWSVGVVAGLLSWLLATQVLPDTSSGRSDAAYWLASTCATIAFLGALLAHELSHSLVASRRGIRVRGITLWVLGGIATLEGEPRSPDDELVIALAGPATSVAIGATALTTAGVADALGLAELLVATLVWLGTVNVLLAVFNLVPAAPLDGGRVLRALLWRRRGDRTSAAVSATRAGVAFGYVLVGVGFVEVVAGAGIGGVWFVFLGWFLVNSARAEQIDTAVTAALAHLRVADVMTRDPLVVPADASVTELIESFVLRHRCSSFPVVEPDQRVIGLATLARVKSVPFEARSATPVRDCAWPLAEVTTATPDEMLLGVLRRATDDGGRRVLVFDDERLVGIISPSDIARTLQAGRRVEQPTRSRP
ncbi:MAG TPA: site-2 protease family protein [Acidimicrobiia bacterium]|nr:site-2 protease family protein [Acidimicrobiia bacterium]